MHIDIGKCRVLWFPGFFLDMFRHHPTGKLWLVWRFGFSRRGKHVDLGPVTIDWSGGPWMA